VISFYGFLHLQSGEFSAVNASVRSLEHKTRTYVNNAILLSRSLRANGFQFELLVNDAPLIQRIVPNVEQHLTLRQIDFVTPVPSGVRFYSGHFKIDAFRYLSTLNKDSYAALIDLDMVCVNPAPPELFAAAANKTPLIYDITDQVVPSAGEAMLKDQLEEILDRSVDLWWSGGEFVAGSPEFFADLSETCDQLFQRYLDVSVGRYRVGNEPYQNAALHHMSERQWELTDAGAAGIVTRYWNMPVKHRQPPFKKVRNAFLMHLPVDKHVLALMLILNPTGSTQFLAYYSLLRWLWLPLELFNRGLAQLGIR
jgi:hypothetical protein